MEKISYIDVCALKLITVVFFGGGSDKKSLQTFGHVTRVKTHLTFIMSPLLEAPESNYMKTQILWGTPSSTKIKALNNLKGLF